MGRRVGVQRLTALRAGRGEEASSPCVDGRTILEMENPDGGAGQRKGTEFSGMQSVEALGDTEVQVWVSGD